MRNILILALLVICLGACAKKLTMQEIPSVVQTEFINRYEEVEDLKWSFKPKKDTYTAKFNTAGQKVEIDFNSAGKVLGVRQ